MKPFLHKSDGGFAHFQWNLDQSVGKGAQNGSHCDVSYIQWYYTLAAAHPLTPPDRKTIYSHVKITGLCLGTDKDPLIPAIIAQQQAISHPIVDGRVSVATGDGKVGGAKAFFILRLNARLADMFPMQWPRLDLIPNCPAIVAKASRDAIPKL
jgi:hypothetical protein